MSDKIQIKTGTTSDATSADETLLNDVDGSEFGITDDRTAGVGDVRGWFGDPDDSSWTDLHTAEPRGAWATPADLDAAIATAIPLADLDTDTTLAADSNSKVPSQHAVKTLVANSVAGLLDYKGGVDCSANPNFPAALKGDTYFVTVAGKIGGASGVSVDVSDMIVANADNAGGTLASVGTSWNTFEHNLVGALLAANNLSDLTSASSARTNLGLVIGTNVQAWDTDLDTWATKTAPGGTVVGTSDSQTLSSKVLDDSNSATFKDNALTVENNSDTTKKVVFDLGFVGTGQTRTVSFPNANITVVGTAATQTLTNKTLTSPAITTPTGIVKGDVGLGNVDNTSDATKNIGGTAANLSGTPALPNGTTATTQSAADNSTKLATTAYVDGGLGGKQPLDSDLTTIAGLTATSDNFMVAASSAWSSMTPATALTKLSGAAGADFSLNSHKLTSVTDPASAQDAATKNYVDTRLYSSVNSSISDLTNTNVETTLFTATSIAAANLAVGQVYRLHMGGTLDNASSSGTLTLRIKIGGSTQVTILLISPSQTGSASAAGWGIHGDMVIKTTGASGVVVLYGDSTNLTTAGGGQNPRPWAVTTGAININTSLDLTVTAQWQTAALANVLRTMSAVMHRVV